MPEALKEALRIHVRGVVQGVGFRPFVYRLATKRHLTGWVLNGNSGVEIYVEGDAPAVDDFVREIQENPPPAAHITEFESTSVTPQNCSDFAIRESDDGDAPTVRVSPDLPVCEDCLRELCDPNDRRFGYPYINCTNCGPRYSIITGLPYDRPNTTMRDWAMCDACRSEYENPLDRRFHAQPVACSACGPNYILEEEGMASTQAGAAIARAAQLLSGGAIVAVKGVGGYHLACDARNSDAVQALRERKYRKERPFAVMARDIQTAEAIANIGIEARELLTSVARPIVLAPAKVHFRGVAPENDDLGVMLPYTPLHHLLFTFGAPDVLVMTSANRSSEPIAYRDEHARESLAGIADALLIGEREIARRIDDSVFGPKILRHARGLAPQAVAAIPSSRKIVALGADLKNSIALVVGGQAFLSQHIGDLEQYEASRAFGETIRDLTALYEVQLEDAIVVHDAHPGYFSTDYASSLPGRKHIIQHHRAHIASVLAERGKWDTRVIGFAFDGTGYGDDGTIWGGEIFLGDVASGFERVGHLRTAMLPGGDAAARFPLQAAAGFLHDLEFSDLTRAPFYFPQQYDTARRLLRADIRSFRATSMGRLFDTVAALLGFTRPITFEAQAAMWVEHLARSSAPVRAYPFPFTNAELDFRPLLAAIVRDRIRGRDSREIARAFHHAIVQGIISVCDLYGEKRVVVSGGIFQNTLLLSELHEKLGDRLWTNHIVPPNDGGIALGQAALASVLR